MGQDQIDVQSFAAIAIAYLIGSFPTAYLLVRHLKGIDIRSLGSRNSGALNAYRNLGSVAGLLVMVVDIGKGALAVFVAERIGASDMPLYVAALLTTLGHNFSPFLGFRGGKGVSTLLGICTVLLWPITMIALTLGALLFVLTRHTVWSLTAVLLILNSLNFGTSQTKDLTLLCLGLSFVVAGTHILRRYPELSRASRQKHWWRFMDIE